MIYFLGGGEWWITHYDGMIDGLDGDLADGETFTATDGSACSRFGDEMVVTSPGRGLKLAA
jgi:hypothetical protein